MGHISTKHPFRALSPTKVDVYISDVKVHYSGGNAKPPPPAKREQVAVFTRKSRQRLAFVASNTEVEFLSLLTLTYPAQYPSDGRLVKNHLNRVLGYLRRRHYEFDYLWFLEFQKRGAPHIHLLLSTWTDTIEQLWISSTWYKIVASGDKRHLAAGTNHENVRKTDGGKRYVVKYAMKMRQKIVPKAYRNVGRFWGHSQFVKPRPVIKGVPITGTDNLKELCQKWEYAKKLDAPLSVLYNASVAVSQQLIESTADNDSVGA
jgi:hypothetical protein